MQPTWRKPLRICAFALFVVLATDLPLIAETGDAAAVIQYCGTPTSEHQGISEVTNKMQRDLTYGDLILHFIPAEGGWAFQSAWDNHLPLTEKMTEARSACFQQAMAASRMEEPAGPVADEDPTIRREIITPSGNESTFGVPHLWLIVALFAALIVFFLIPGGHGRRGMSGEIEALRVRRKPRLISREQRRSAGTSVSG